MEIRPECDADRALIGAVVEAAFESPVEARLVENLRESDVFVPDLSLVAEADGELVGHAMTTWVALENGEVTHRVLSLAPLAVAPRWQNTGVGSALVRETIAKAEAMGEPMVVLQGAPAYYSRFGFEASEPLGVTMDLPDWAPREAAQLVRLTAYDAAVRGRVIYPPAFNGID